MSLTWLPLSLRKNVTLPKVIFEEDVGQKYSGFYTLGTTEIVVVASDEVELEAATLAHEYCHYLQNLQGRSTVTPKSYNWNQLSATLSYEEAIRVYFHKNFHELEALLFEHKYATNWSNDWWLRKLVGYV